MLEVEGLKEWLCARGRKIEGVVNGYVLEAERLKEWLMVMC